MTETYNQMLAVAREIERQNQQTVFPNKGYELMARVIEHQARLIDMAREALADLESTLGYCVGRASFNDCEKVVKAQIECCYKTTEQALAELSGDKPAE